MTKVTFFDGQLNPLMKTDKMISLNITKKYRGYGGVEIHFPITMGDILSLIDKYKCLVCVTPEATAIITGWRVGEDIALFGRTAEWLLTKRYLPPFTLTALGGAAAEYAVTQAADDFADVEIVQEGETQKEYKFETLTSVYDIVLNALEDEDMGFSLDADPKAKRFKLTVYKGLDNALILSRSERTACEICCTGDRQSSVSAGGWYMREMEDMGEWNPYTNSPSLTAKSSKNLFKYYYVTRDGKKFGISFKEGQYAYCDNPDGILKASDTKPEVGWDYIENTEITGAERWEGAIFEKTLPEDAPGLMTEKPEKLESEALIRHIEYKKDYNLGDKVKIQTEFGSFRKTIQKQITAVDIFYDTDGCGICPHME